MNTTKVYCGKKFKFDSGNGIIGSAFCGMFMLWTTMQCSECMEKEKLLKKFDKKRVENEI